MSVYPCPQKYLVRDRRGSALLFVMIFGAIAFTMIVMGLSGYALFEHRAARRLGHRDQAFHVAEAGIDYYRWHLAHSPTDYTDGTGEAGPYLHEYTDKDGTVLGAFLLAVSPPDSGSTVVTVSSTGWTLAEPTAKRTVQVRLGYPALTDYAIMANSNMHFSYTTQVSGAVQANGGIRFDGTSDSWVRSSKETYQYQNQTHNGVWGGGGPKSFWQYPVPAVDFNGLTADLAAIKTQAQAGGVYLTSSGDEGWHLVFKPDRTFDVYRVDTRRCYNGEGKYIGKWWQGNVYCYDIDAEQFVANYPHPGNGYIFVEDHIWVEGIIAGHLTVGAGRFPSSPANYRNIYLPGNITYAAVSQDVLGLITQGDIVIPHDVPETMTVQAALLSQYGKIYRPYYYQDERDSLTIFGSQISYNGSGYKYVNGWGNVVSGFVNTNHMYDANLKYYPPPGFPVENTYEMISWEEVGS
ncbi:MAG: hypothetical protein UY92_C0004G0052 [Candidatus Magasanikbacteria bacterium GW2011_GWA2_56_11]|uniref:Uncharacterized protein n=1 Tax=Candidatus Magasanikbacteria bacterium GW2011_GWA2_56_11 TaxID=1619044 RepID=A0A0G1YHK8_9BACT|nr:MAG: hypothetical protein UY92_C0004G0052 [Candidatus Magasanikbacteria bacterium GW2011_GWA2_56_11]